MEVKQKVEVIQEGVLAFKGKEFPWRALQNGALEIFDEEKKEWKEVISLDEVVK